jgi:hypothetical protein
LPKAAVDGVVGDPLTAHPGEVLRADLFPIHLLQAAIRVETILDLMTIGVTTIEAMEGAMGAIAVMEDTGTALLSEVLGVSVLLG